MTTDPGFDGSARKRVMLDFDGVLHHYTTGYTGPVPEDRPTPGALAFVEELQRRGYEVVVFTSRVLSASSRSASAVYGWLVQHGFIGLRVTHEKLPAVLYVDDRGFRFNGDFTAVLELLDDTRGALLPWMFRVAGDPDAGKGIAPVPIAPAVEAAPMWDEC